MCSCTESFGGRLNNVYLTEIYCVFILCVVLPHLYWVKPIPPVRPSSPGLPQGTSTFGLGLVEK